MPKANSRQTTKDAIVLICRLEKCKHIFCETKKISGPSVAKEIYVYEARRSEKPKMMECQNINYAPGFPAKKYKSVGFQWLICYHL
jgi:hypothetical protein